MARRHWLTEILLYPILPSHGEGQTSKRKGIEGEAVSGQLTINFEEGLG